MYLIRLEPRTITLNRQPESNRQHLTLNICMSIFVIESPPGGLEEINYGIFISQAALQVHFELHRVVQLVQSHLGL